MKITGQTITPVNPQMEWGSRLESVIRNKYVEVTGRKVICNEDPDKLGLEYAHPDYPYLTGSLDGIAYTDNGSRVLEIKTARSRDAWDGGVPEYYQLQCQHYMGLTGIGLADVAVLFGASDFEIYEVIRDDDIIQTVTALLVGFWQNHIETGIPPECTTPGDRNTRWPKSEAKSVVADSSMVETLSVLKSTRNEIKRLETIQADLESIVKDALQENDTLLIEGRPAVTWKSAKPSLVFDKDSFAREQPNFYKQYLHDKPGSRRFLLK
jgi:predicted phage-related endonuclease